MDAKGIRMGNQFSVDSSGDATFAGTLSVGSLPTGTVTGSAQLAAAISGSSNDVSASLATQTAQQLDNLGPHLEGNLDMLAHIGTIMRYLGREEHLQWMLKMAQITYPNDSNVAKAMTHLS